ncbi:Protein lethal(2)essential for life [Habropoda laboriosa]|uniref:Protein lethal(2)essential for life n=1 Tax=Habropoda laboriosa TaxID=597456 RepID=A0A0L7RHF8_9HYME|nr:PREDICTED: protein lethal(2)essential for life-like [Habropoda laboriosa]KOC70254.1 Protein lethal(2)essential for life [Habropoda laboriosa]
MSLLPLLYSAWWADLDRPHRLMDQHFGMGLHPEQLTFLPSWPNSILNNRAALDLYYRPISSELLRRGETGTSTITAGKDTFKVMLDVQQFKPEEISVKVIDRCVVVEAKHEERKDEHGLISRQFMRKYWLPQQVEENELSSNISSDGILTITAPLKEKEGKSNERRIKIELTDKPAIRFDKPSEGKTTATKPETPDSPKLSFLES